MSIPNLPELMGLESVGLQIFLFALYFSIGAFAIVLYSLYSWGIARAVRSRRKRRLIFFVADLFFWIQYAFVSFIVIYHANNAKMRLFYYLIILAGLITAYNIKLHILKKRRQ